MTGLAVAALLRYPRYFDAWSREPVSAATAADQLGFLKRAYLRNDRPVIGYRMAHWKRRAVSVMLDGPNGPPRFTGASRKPSPWRRPPAATSRPGGRRPSA